MRRLRRARDLSLMEVGDRVGIGEPRLSVLERGLAQPTKDQRDALEQFYGKPWAELSADAREVA